MDRTDATDATDAPPVTRAPRPRRRWGIGLRGAVYRSGELAFLGVIAALTGLTGFAAYTNIQEHGWTSDAAAWAQAAGSIIAIAGAAWLARGEARQARRWRREQGEEAAWSVRFVIAQAQFDAQIIAAELTKPDAAIDSDSVRSWKQRAAHAGLCLQAIMTRVDHIHPAVLVSASNAKILADGLLADLQKYEELRLDGKAPSDELARDIVYAHVNLAALLEQFDARARGIKEALDRGGDMLPLREFND